MYIHIIHINIYLYMYICIYTYIGILKWFCGGSPIQVYIYIYLNSCDTYIQTDIYIFTYAYTYIYIYIPVAGPGCIEARVSGLRRLSAPAEISQKSARFSIYYTKSL